MYKDVELHIATLRLDRFTLRAEGVLEQPYDWFITMNYPNTIKAWRRNEYLSDADEVTEMMWEEAIAIIQKYSYVVHEKGITEVELETVE